MQLLVRERAIADVWGQELLEAFQRRNAGLAEYIILQALCYDFPLDLEPVEQWFIANKDKDYFYASNVAGPRCLEDLLRRTKEALSLEGSTETGSDVSSAASVRIACSILKAADEIKIKAIHYAAHNGDLEVLKMMQQNGANICETDHVNSQPIHYACLGGAIEVVRWLLDQGVDVSAKEFSRNQPIHIAAYKGLLEIIILLVDRGASIEAERYLQGEKYPLYLAVRRGHLEVVQWFLGQKATLSPKDKKRLVRLAAARGHLALVQLLLKEDEKSFVKEHGGKLLRVAAGNGHQDLVEWLIRQGVDVNCRKKGKWTALHYAACDWAKIAEYLVQHGADPCAKNDEGVTPIELALEVNKKSFDYLLSSTKQSSNLVHLIFKYWYERTEKCLKILRRLVELNDHAIALDDEGMHLAHYAALVGNFGVMRWIYENGADIFAVNKHGSRVIHYAAQSGNCELVQWLVERGADILSEDDEGRQSIHYAACMGHLKVVQWLIDHGARASLEDKYGNRPVDYATKAQNGRALVDWFHGKGIFEKKDAHCCCQ